MKLILDIESGVSGKPYNIGYLIIKKNKIVKKRNFVILENISSSQYSNCFAKILNDIGKRKHQFTYLTNKEFQRKFASDLTKFEIKKVYGFNISYDKRKLEMITKAAHDLTFYDLRTLIIPYLSGDYEKFCFNNGYLTKHGKPKTTLEVIYRYLTNDLNFNQEHTGLSDCLMEFKLYKKLRDS